MGTLYIKNIPFPKVLKRKTIDNLIGEDHPELMLALTESYGPFGALEARKTSGSYKLTRQKTVQADTCYPFQSSEKIVRPSNYA